MRQQNISSSQIYQSVLTALSQNSDGLSIEELLKKIPCSRRQLQRHLLELVKQKSIDRIGKGRATRYKKEDKKEVSYEQIILISEGSRDIIEYVRRPLIQRQPVSYDPHFISTYEPNKTWYLGEAARAHLKQIGSPPEAPRVAGTFGCKILDRLLIDLSWASSRLEGNTYSRLDTVELIECGVSAKGKDAKETQMILNHKAAINFIVNDIENMEIHKYILLNLHGLLSEGLLADPDACGRLRYRPVNISGTPFKPLAIPQKIEEIFEEIITKANQISDPFEQAFFLMVHIPYLQPFEDVNKRVSRLALNIPLLKNNLCPLTFLDVPEHAYVEAMLGIYEMTRTTLLQDLFVWAYERSAREYIEIQKTLVDPDPIRLKYRQFIHTLIRNIVRHGIIDTVPEIHRYTETNIPENDRERFIEIVLDDLKRLHEGVLARYQLHLNEYHDWLKTRN